MADVAIPLTGELFHSDARDLAERINAAFDAGGCVVEVGPGVEKIDFGALQVLVAAAKEAGDRDIAFSIRAAEERNAVSAALAAHALSQTVPVVIGELNGEAVEH